MAAISAAQVKELRERTGAGMMECKKALVETGGDLESAIDLMRKTGLAKADKKAGRTAAEGLVVARRSEDGHCAVLLEVNCETDFVAKNEDFQAFALTVADLVLEQNPADIDTVLTAALPGGQTVDERRRELVAKIGENIAVRRFERYVSESGALNAYLHGGRIGVLVELAGGDENLAKDIAMHVAASNPGYNTEDEVPTAVLDKEKEILSAQARDSGKPENIIEKMVEGRLRKFLAEITLIGQPFVKDPDQSVRQLLETSDATVRRFIRLELGEGIEKKTDNFAEEVMAQVRGDE
jgi:elongation factor Ts